MGIIKRQSIKNSLVNYVGVGIGAVSVIFIYPLIDRTELGMIQFAMNTAILFASFAALASSMTATKFYPIFRSDDQTDNGFVPLLTASTLTASLVFIGLIYLFRLPIAALFQTDAAQFLNSLHFILIFTVCIAVGNLYTSFAANQNRIVVPSIFQNLLIKIAQPSLVLLYFYGVIKFAEIFKGLALTLFLMVAGLVGYVFFLRKRSFSPKILRGGILTKSLGFEMLRFSSFNLLVVLGGLFAQRVDQLLIVPLLGYEKLAIFSFGFFIAEAIDVPRKALSSIAQPLLSTSILEKNWAHVAEIYRKTALLQVVVGVFMLAGIWACADALFDLMPKNGAAFRTGKWVILILGLSRLADMATGTNAEIITLSDYYRFNFRSFLTMALLNIVLNLLLIPRFGIEGSAAATLISIATVNVWRLFFIKKKFNMQPLDWKMVAVVGFGLAAWFITDLTPSVSQPILTILLKGLIISVLYGFLILYFKISPEVNAAFNKVKTTIFK